MVQTRNMNIDETITREEGHCGCLPNRFRFVILIVALFALTSVSSNMFTVNIALICMAPSDNTSSSLVRIVFVRLDSYILIG
jgi:hypothetical protein